MSLLNLGRLTLSAENEELIRCTLEIIVKFTMQSDLNLPIVNFLNILKTIDNPDVFALMIQIRESKERKNILSCVENRINSLSSAW